MSNEKSLSKNDVSRFLLGLGIGLVVGIILKLLPSDDYSRRSRESAATPKSGSHGAPATSRR
jgi:hypothetical protein